MNAAAERQKVDAAVFAAITYVSAGASLVGFGIKFPDDEPGSDPP